MTSVQLTQVMGVGWNLGNSLDAIGGETAWGNPKTTLQMIQLVKQSGFDAIRLPVSWNQYANQNNAAIDAAWLNRVREVVQYSVDSGLYVIVNIHWDGGWIDSAWFMRFDPELHAAAREGRGVSVTDIAMAHGAVAQTDAAALRLKAATGSITVGQLDTRTTTMAEVMTPNPQTLDPDCHYVQALQLMHDGGFRHVPVVEGGGTKLFAQSKTWIYRHPEETKKLLWLGTHALAPKFFVTEHILAIDEIG